MEEAKILHIYNCMFNSQGTLRDGLIFRIEYLKRFQFRYFLHKCLGQLLKRITLYLQYIVRYFNAKLQSV